MDASTNADAAALKTEGPAPATQANEDHTEDKQGFRAHRGGHGHAHGHAHAHGPAGDGDEAMCTFGLEPPEPCVPGEEMAEGTTCQHHHEMVQQPDGSVQVQCVHTHSYTHPAPTAGTQDDATLQDQKESTLRGALLVADQAVCKSRDSNRQAVRRYRERKKHELHDLKRANAELRSEVQTLRQQLKDQAQEHATVLAAMSTGNSSTALESAATAMHRHELALLRSQMQQIRAILAVGSLPDASRVPASLLEQLVSNGAVGSGLPEAALGVPVQGGGITQPGPVTSSGAHEQPASIFVSGASQQPQLSDRMLTNSEAYIGLLQKDSSHPGQLAAHATQVQGSSPSYALGSLDATSNLHSMTSTPSNLGLNPSSMPQALALSTTQQSANLARSTVDALQPSMHNQHLPPQYTVLLLDDLAQQQQQQQQHTPQPRQ